MLSILTWVTGSNIIDREKCVEESDLSQEIVIPRWQTEFGVLGRYPGEGLTES